MSEQVVVVLKRNRVCKNSVRYDCVSEADGKLLRSVYVGNDAVQEIDARDRIEVTIKPASA